MSVNADLPNTYEAARLEEILRELSNEVDSLRNDIVTSFNGSTGTFGEATVAELSPTVQLSNQYGLDPNLRDDMQVFTGAAGGTADSTDNLWRCQSSTTQYGYAVIRSKDVARYAPGQGTTARLTAQFTTGIASSLQFAGLFSLTETCAIGYDGAAFSVIHDHDGHGEIQEIQITLKAADTVSVTLESQTGTVTTSSISTLGNSEEEDAKIIANALNADSNQTANWNIRQVGDKIICAHKSTAALGNGYTYSATTLTMTFTETLTGKAKTENRVAQGQWNGGDTSFLDPTKLNVYQIQFGYLGAWGINFSVINPDTGLWVLMHRITWSNSQTVAQFGNPVMQIGYTAASLGSSGTNLTVKGASMAAFIEGRETTTRKSQAVEVSQNTSASTTAQNYLAIRCSRTYGYGYNYGDVVMIEVAIDNELAKSLVVDLLLNPDIDEGTTYQDWQSVNAVNSIVEYDSNIGTVTNGSLLTSFSVASSGTTALDLTPFNIFLLPDDVLCVAVRKASSGGSASEIITSLTWREEK